MVVRDRELDAGQPPLAQAQEKVRPVRAALAVGKLDGQDLPPALPVPRFREGRLRGTRSSGVPHQGLHRRANEILVPL